MYVFVGLSDAGQTELFVCDKHALRTPCRYVPTIHDKSTEGVSLSSVPWNR
jgi:hypothetical protein